MTRPPAPPGAAESAGVSAPAGDPAPAGASAPAGGSAPAGDPAPADAAASRRVALIVAAAFFMETLDGTVVNTALPAIAASFGATALDLSLSVTAYLVAMAVFVPSAGWCAQRLGARAVFAGAVGVFTLASLLCALAPTLATFVAARLLQGAAAAFMSPVGRVVVLAETPPGRVIEAIATITWPGLVAPVLGPLLGGLIVTYTSWRWIFLLNLPLGLLGVWLVLRHVPQRPRGPAQRFDLAGFVLTGFALTSAVLGLTWLGERHGDTATALALVAAGLLAGAFAVRHARRAAAPLLDLSVLAVRSYRTAVLGVGFASRIAINAAPFLLPLMFQIGFGMGPLQAGVMVLVYMAGNLLMKVGTTRLLRRHGFRKVLVFNGVLCALALAGCGGLAPGQPLLAVCAVLLLAGLTRSMNFTAINTLAFVDVPAPGRAAASALATMLQQLAMTLSVALAASALGLAQAWRGAPALALADFRVVWALMALLMAGVVVAAWRLERDIGAKAASFT